MSLVRIVLAFAAPIVCAASALHPAINPVIGILTVPMLEGGCITLVDGAPKRQVARTARALLFHTCTTRASRTNRQVVTTETGGATAGSCFDSLYNDWVSAAGGRSAHVRTSVCI